MAANIAAIMGVLAAIVVAGAVAATVIFVKEVPENNNSSNNNDNNREESRKAIDNLCSNTYYQQTCIDSLSRATNSSDLKTLIQAGFKVAVKELGHANEKLRPLEIQSDNPAATAAFRTCQKFLDDSMNDLERTSDRTDSLDFDNFWVVMDDIQTWLTGALTYQDSCLDGFEGVKGDDVKKVEQFLKPAQEITLNGLAMVTLFGKLLEQTGLGQSAPPEGGDLTWPKGEPKTHDLLHGDRAGIKPNVTVAQDGSGKYRTINEALREVPYRSNNTFVIYVKEGVYKEYVNITSAMWSVMLVGDGPTKTKITGNKNKVSLVNLDTYWTATVVIEGDNFIGRDIGFENTAGGEMHQAVALLVAADKAIFYNCQIDGYQDTLCTHNHRQFYRDCTISGTVDFIFGNARAVLQNCTLVVRKPLLNQACMVTAHGRKYDNETSALVLQSCRIIPAPDFPVDDKKYRVYLGRPWKRYAKTIVMDSQIDGFLHPAGWADWESEKGHLDTCFYAEVNNKGVGANLSGRIKAPGIRNLSGKEANEYTPGTLLRDYWIGGLGIPYSSGRISSS